MYCSKCGEKNEVGANFCKGCGQKIIREIKGNKENIESSSIGLKDKKVVEDENNKSFKGIEGWLQFFVFSLFISIVLVSIGAVQDISMILSIKGLSSEWMYNLIGFDILYFSAVILFIIYVIQSFIKLKPNAISLAKMYLVFLFINNVFNFLFWTSAESLFWTNNESNILRSIVWAIIWFLYLTYSKRVNNTFPKKERVIKLFDKIYFIFLLVCISLLFIIPFMMD